MRLFFEMVKVAVHALLARKMRTLLTMLGIIVGVGSVVVMLAYGEGQKQELLKSFEGWGDKQMSLRLRYWNWRAVAGSVTAPRSVQLDYGDVEAIRSGINSVQSVVPVADGMATLRRDTISLEEYSLTATEGEYFGIMGDRFDKGKPFTADDCLMQARVCVLGFDAWQQLFVAADPIDDYVMVNGKRFRVVGTLLTKGNDKWYDQQVFIPYQTGVERTSIFEGMDNIQMELRSMNYIEYATRQLMELMYERHPQLPVPEGDPYDEDRAPMRVRSMASRMADREQAADSFAILLLVIGGLSLLIGGVGVMNIMLVAIHQRTVEIGLRKALGAKRRHIIYQFMIEAMIICIVGGLLGNGIAWFACRWLARLPDEAQIPDPVITPGAILIAVLVTLGTGLFFGIWPALRAAKLDPIKALRGG
jgi:putative ABC transport system permease protein